MEDRGAEEELAGRYMQLVRQCARPLFLAGGDSEDLIQEGTFGLLSAIRRFDPACGVSFKTFAEHCVRMRLLSAIKSASRLKHFPLNDGMSLENSPRIPAQIYRHFPRASGVRRRIRFWPERARKNFIQPLQSSYRDWRERFSLCIWTACPIRTLPSALGKSPKLSITLCRE